ncbi:hypothetical protein [Streptomyces ochraceiscleroticus]|uniref:NUDIX hydrolase n=1 Tax=Streptomyces ochraceiscleroticus TaxID=47761 RepID=A0ABW1MB69_9ACTN|nr:hypothetical protein [Streptomyces ochraceiscleroticus]
MDFFPPPRPRDEEPGEEPEFTRVPWESAPEDVIGGVVPLERVLARNDHLAIVATQAVAYEDGVEIRLRMRARRRPGMSREDWARVSRGVWGYDDDPWQLAAAEAAAEQGRHPDELLRFGVRFADGCVVTTVDEREDADEWPGPRPELPVLTLNEEGGGSSGENIDSEYALWLWPLPPPQLFELAVEWPLLGVGLTFTPLDGAEIAAAAARARPFWDD